MISLKKNSSILHILLIAVIGFAVYYNSLHGQFIWDDRYQVTKNIFIRHWSNLGEMFSKNMGVGSGYPSPFYRPMQSVIYLFNYCLWGLNPLSFHLTSVILHIFAAIALYFLINILIPNRLSALVAALLFVTAPLGVETVAFISDLADILAALFMLLCFIVYIKNLDLDSIKANFLIGLTYLLALLSKENSLIFPLLLLMFHWAFKVKVNIKKLLFIAGITFAYLFIRLAIGPSNLIFPAPETLIFKSIPTFFASTAQYLKIIFFPRDLHMEYSYRYFSLSDPQAILGLISAAILLTWAFKQKEKNSYACFAMFWFFIMLLPTSNIYSINDSFAAERWLYFPAIGIFMLLAEKIVFLGNKKGFGGLTIFAVIGALFSNCLLTVNQNKYWHDPVNFYERTLKYNPESAKTYNELGIEYEALNRHSDAEEAYKNAIKYKPALTGVHYNLARLYQKLGKLNLAILNYTKEIEINPDYGLAYNNRAVAYYDKRDYAKAWEDVRKAESLGFDVNTGFLAALKKASGGD